MIVPSSNEGAAACIHGVGYSFPEAIDRAAGQIESLRIGARTLRRWARCAPCRR